MRILAVDDDPGILQVLTAFLEAEGTHQVVTATSGAEALAIIDRADFDFDCLLLDIQMPEMNGIELCETIRTLQDYRHVPIIMLTAMSQSPYIDRAFAVDATDYVTKPFDLLDLTYRLKAAVKISHEYGRVCDVAETALRLTGNFGTEEKPPPEEPLPINGVERVVACAAFENYVLALSGTKLLFASVFAVKMVDFDLLHAAVSSRGMLAILTTVAQVITEQIPGPGDLVSYRGNGVFLCVNQGMDASASNRLKIHVIDAGNEKKPVAREIQVIFGQKVSLVSISKTGALVALGKAIELIERQPLPAKEFAELSKRVLRNQSRAPEQSHLERRAYEVFLEEILREEQRVAR